MKSSIRTALALAAFAFSAAAQNLTSACGPRSQNFVTSHGPAGDTAAPADSAKAAIYVVEVYSLHDKGRFNRPTVRVGLNGAWAGATQGLSFVRLDVAPGEHHLCSQWQSALSAYTDQVSLLNLNVEAGKAYYLRIQIMNDGRGENSGPGLLDLQPVSSDEGRYLVSIAAQSTSRVK